MRSSKYLSLSYLLIPVIPLISIMLSTDSRELYFDTKTTIPTTKIVKIAMLVLAVSIGLTFSQSITYIYKKTILKNLKIHRYLPNLSFIIFIFIPNIFAEFNLEHPARFIYKIFRVSYLNPPFADLRTIIYGIKCSAVSQIGDLITCDTRNAEYVRWIYPTILLKLRSVSFLFENITLVVILISVFLALSIQILSFNQTLIQNLFLTGIILSPPFLLCYGRLNFDLFILWIIWIGIFSLKSKSRILKYCSFIMFFFAGLLKFYGFAAFISIFKNLNLRKFLIGIAFLFIGLNLIKNDFSNLQNAVGKDVYGSIGFPVVSALLNGLQSANLSLLSYGSVFTIIFIITYVSLIVRENFRNKFDENNLIQLVFGFTFLSTWFTASNYYYRLLLLIPILLVMIKNKNTFFEKTVISSTYFCFFLSPKVFGPLQNFFLLPMVCYLIAHLLLFTRNEIEAIIKRKFNPV